MLAFEVRDGTIKYTVLAEDAQHAQTALLVYVREAGSSSPDIKAARQLLDAQTLSGAFAPHAVLCPDLRVAWVVP